MKKVRAKTRNRMFSDQKIDYLIIMSDETIWIKGYGY